MRDLLESVAYAAIMVILLLSEGCASIGNPSGGPRDERPPRYVSATPAPGSVNISENQAKIQITFDELVNVKDAFSKVIVSPPGKSTPRVTSQGHRVYVQFPDSLLPNTTYTIDFADAIEDNNEGNKLNNFAYTFSTGPTIDTLRISGRVLSAQGLEPMQLKLVGIHRIDDDETLEGKGSEARDISESTHHKLFTDKFFRVGRTDDRGRFSIEGLPAGEYRIYALDDANSDYLFTNSDEQVGFYDLILSPTVEETVAVDSIFNLRTGALDTVKERRRTLFLPNDVVIRSFATARKQQFITKYERQDTTLLKMQFNAPMREMPDIRLLGFKGKIEAPIIEHSAGFDTLSIWLVDPRMIDTDTLRVAVNYQHLDSLQRYVTKSDTLRFTSDRKRLRSEAEKARKEYVDRVIKQQKKDNRDKTEKGDAKNQDEEIEIKIPTNLLKAQFISSATQEISAPMILESERPLASIDIEGVHLERRRDTIWDEVKEISIMQDTLNPRRYAIRPEKWDYDTEYRITIDSLAIKGIYGLHNGTIKKEIKTRGEKEYSGLTLTLSGWPTGVPAVVELLNGNDSPIARATAIGGKARFSHILPGKYYVRAFADYNSNGEWDSGDPLIDRQPEMAFYYPKAITIKANWQKEETWDVFGTPIDKMKPEAILKNKPTQQRNAKQTAKKEDEEDNE